jgi:serine protease inhibitor
MKPLASKSFLILTLVIPLIFMSCTKSPDENLPKDPVPINLTQVQTSLVGSGNAFAFDIFRKIVENTDPEENIIISPLSISYALSMTLNGADGSTREAMLETLRVNGITPDEINTAFEKLTEALLKVDKRVIMTIANSVWTEKEFDVKQAFINILTEYYNAESKDFDITDPAVPAKVNTWIEDKTNGLIRDMISSLPDNTVMLLINAIYFKGKWTSEFDADQTQDQPFYLLSGASAEVPTMMQKSDFRIFDGDGFVMGEFPYGQGNFVMDIILPDDKNGLDELLPSITDVAFGGWVDQMRERKVNLFLPRFKYDFKKGLVDILTDMGMGIAFTDGADFTNITEYPPLQITDVLHQAFIETNEEGTEAAAATVVVIGITSVGPDTPFPFVADHPFIYVIREVTTGSVIFVGRVADPLAE